MARKDRYRQARGKDYDKKAAEEASLRSNAATGREIEPINNAGKLPSVRKKEQNALRADTQILGVSRPNALSVDSSRGSSASLQTQVRTADNNVVYVGNSSTSRSNRISVAALSLSCFLVLFLLLFCIAPLKQVSYVVPVVYQDTETYMEQEPYMETVSYSEKEPYTVTEAYTVSEPYVTAEPYFLYDPQQGSLPFPRPPRPSSGNWTPPRPPTPPQPVVQYREVTRYTDVTKYRDVLQYRDVQKSKNEIRFRPVQKQRTVTKVRQETRYRMVPMLYSLIV